MPLRFYGFDLPGGAAGPVSPREVLDLVLAYLDGAGDETGARRARLADLLGLDADWENPLAWRDPATSAARLAAANALRLAVEDLIAELRVRRPELVAKTGYERFAEALHYAAMARELLNFFVALREEDYAASLAVRDALMADNLAHIAARERERGKVHVFAHNAHLQRGHVTMPIGEQVCRWWPVGAHLTVMLGDRYAVIGSAVGVSEANGIGRPEAGTLEARLTAAPGPARFVPTHGGRGLPVAAIAALPTRSHSTRNPTYAPLTPQALTDFDWLVVLDQSELRTE